jgi:hypothetical protein
MSRSQVGLEELHEAADDVGGYFQCDQLGDARSGCYDPHRCLWQLGPLETSQSGLTLVDSTHFVNPGTTRQPLNVFSNRSGCFSE